MFGLATHLYSGTGYSIVDLEKDPNVLKAMQSLFVSSEQVVNKMPKTECLDFYNSNKIRAYLKTKNGIYFKELDNLTKEDMFLNFLVNNILLNINKEI